MGYGHNKLSLEEAEELLKEVKSPWKRPPMQCKGEGVDDHDDTFVQADLDGDGKLDYTEFTQMMLWDLED